ncbi:hypothetical protein ACFXP7_12360 [Microbacterium sp. P06]|uniref:hypothetical protein n=1 Tax=Microbacterium sp. P06 TaxID=3366949 RepID=UPI003745D564
MSSPDEMPRIADHPVDPAALAVLGTSLAALAAELGAVEIADRTDDVPDDGWRVLQTDPRGAAILGAPVSAGADTFWRLAHLQHAYTNQDQEQTQPSVPRWVVIVDPALYPAKPSLAERRRGLEVRWPPGSSEHGPPFLVEIVNTRAMRVELSADELLVVGVVTPPQTTNFSFGYFSANAADPLVLQPGGSALVPVRMQEGDGRGRAPGPVELHAMLVNLGLHAPVLAIRM